MQDPPQSFCRLADIPDHIPERTRKHSTVPVKPPPRIPTTSQGNTPVISAKCQPFSSVSIFKQPLTSTAALLQSSIPLYQTKHSTKLATNLSKTPSPWSASHSQIDSSPTPTVPRTVAARAQTRHQGQQGTMAEVPTPVVNPQRPTD